MKHLHKQKQQFALQSLINKNTFKEQGETKSQIRRQCAAKPKQKHRRTDGKSSLGITRNRSELRNASRNATLDTLKQTLSCLCLQSASNCCHFCTIFKDHWAATVPEPDVEGQSLAVFCSAPKQLLKNTNTDQWGGFENRPINTDWFFACPPSFLKLFLLSLQSRWCFPYHLLLYQFHVDFFVGRAQSWKTVELALPNVYVVFPLSTTSDAHFDDRSRLYFKSTT